MKKRFPWKGSYRAAPATITAALAQINSDLIIVAATKKIPIQAIADGQYAHLGLQYNGSSVEITDVVMPDANVGRFADRNRFGWDIKRKDLPMITKTFSWDSPNFGDSSRGYHIATRDREIYQVQVFEPRLFSIKIELLNSPGADTALVKFEVDQTLDKTARGFNDDFLFCLNLLQESTGVVNVYPSTATRKDFIGTVMVDWEVFPPGKADEVIAAMTQGRVGIPPNKAGVIAERLKLFNRLPVENFIRGTGNFSSYMGALYADDLVVFENVNYGNALYVLYDDWQDVSKRSRLELLRGTTEDFERIIHTDGWEDRFQELIEKELSKRGRSKRKATAA